MFITSAEVKTMTGLDVTPATVVLAQMMVETWVRRTEVSITDAGDIETMRRAIAFQAVYTQDNADDMLSTPAMLRQTLVENSGTFDVASFAPHMSPWAVKACENLSWRRTRSVRTAPLFLKPEVTQWETD